MRVSLLLRTALALIVAGALRLPAAEAQVVLFDTFKPYPANGGSTSIATADLDLDGKLDLATANVGGNISVLRGLGSGTFAAPVLHAAGDLPVFIASCKLDKDGRPDLVVADYGFGFDKISVFLNTSAGPGSFTFTHTLHAAGSRPVAIACADVDSDGDQDLGIANQDSEDLTLLLNDGNGAFTAGAGPFAAQDWPRAIAAGDLDGDGRPDFAIVNNQSLTVSVLLNQGGGTFGTQTAYTVASGPEDVVAADLDGDGDLDLATGNNAAKSVSVLFNDGAGTFGGRTDYPVAGAALSVIAADLNCDGRLDLVADSAPNLVSVLLNDPADPGKLKPFQKFTVAHDPRGVVAGDFDGTGHLDLATAGQNSATVSVLLNKKKFTYTSVYTAGTDDGFAGSTESAAQNPSLQQFLTDIGQFPPQQFDETGSDTWLGHTFTGIPTCAVKAELELRARAEFGGAGNDSICFEPLGANPLGYAWCSRFERLKEAGGTWGTQGKTAVFKLDLANLIPDGNGVTSVMDLVRKGELSFIVQDDTTVDYAKLTVQSCCSCSAAVPKVRQAGAADNFSAPTDPASPSPSLAGFLSSHTGQPLLPFDDTTSNRWFGHTFTGLPSCLKGARLEIRARPSSFADNDSICLQLLSQSPLDFGWCGSLKSLPGAGGTWNTGGPAVTFSLDLANLPPDSQAVTNVLDLLEQGQLDVIVQDDTAVDYARLHVTPCCEQEPLGGCNLTPYIACLNDRFSVEVNWQDFQLKEGRGQAVPLTNDTGYFWFFDDDNVELVLKVLDGRGLNGRWWIFYGALSTVEYGIKVTDTENGLTRTYTNPSGNLASVGDTSGLPDDPEEALAGLEAEGEEVQLVRLDGDRFAFADAGPPAGIAAPLTACGPTTTSLCLNGSRFMIDVEWKDFAGNEGTGKAVPLTSDTGYFWFFDDDNVELIIKVLDGRTLNGHWWVFYGALSSVEYRITVTDTQTSKTKTYFNPSGVLGSRADTSALTD